MTSGLDSQSGCHLSLYYVDPLADIQYESALYPHLAEALTEPLIVPQVGKFAQYFRGAFTVQYIRFHACFFCFVPPPPPHVSMAHIQTVPLVSLEQ